MIGDKIFISVKDFDEKVTRQQTARQGSAGKGGGRPRAVPTPPRPDYGGKQPRSQGGKGIPVPRPHRYRPGTVALHEIRNTKNLWSC